MVDFGVGLLLSRLRMLHLSKIVFSQKVKFGEARLI